MADPNPPPPEPMAWGRSGAAAAALTLLIALACAPFVFSHNYDIAGTDAVMYLENAARLFEGNRALSPGHFRYLGYSLFLGAMQHGLGLEWTGIRFANLLLQCAMALLVFALLRHRARHPLAPVIGMALAGLYPPGLFISGMILTETFMAFLLIALAVCALRLWERPTIARWGLALVPALLVWITRPTGFLAIGALTALGILAFARKRSVQGALLSLSWIPIVWGMQFLFASFYIPPAAPTPAPAVQSASFWTRWLLQHTYVTREGDSYDAARQRQAAYARQEPDISKISRFMREQFDTLEANIVGEARGQFPEADINPEATRLWQIPRETTHALFRNNLRRHFGHVAAHFARNALHHIWFTRDSMKPARALMLINLPYMLLGLAGAAGLARRRQWAWLLIFLALFAPIWAAHVAALAIARYITPLIPLIALFGTMGVAEWFAGPISGNRAGWAGLSWPWRSKPPDTHSPACSNPLSLS